MNKYKPSKRGFSASVTEEMRHNLALFHLHDRHFCIPEKTAAVDISRRYHAFGFLHEKTRTGASFNRDDFFISYRVYIMIGSFHISLFEGTLHLGKIPVRFKIANITQPLHVPVYRQTDFASKRVVVSRLHDTAERFRTGVKFSPLYKNRGELTPGWLVPAWHLVVVSCEQI